jgi:hypothetical protein
LSRTNKSIQYKPFDIMERQGKFSDNWFSINAKIKI